MKLTKEQLVQYGNSLEQIERYKRKRALRALFEKNSIGYEITDFKISMRVFLWIKCLICLFLNRTNGSYLDACYFCILSYDSRQCLECESWDACWIGYKIFSDWQVCLASDGT